MQARSTAMGTEPIGRPDTAGDCWPGSRVRGELLVAPSTASIRAKLVARPQPSEGVSLEHEDHAGGCAGALEPAGAASAGWSARARRSGVLDGDERRPAQAVGRSPHRRRMTRRQSRPGKRLVRGYGCCGGTGTQPVQIGDVQRRQAPDAAADGFAACGATPPARCWPEMARAFPPGRPGRRGGPAMDAGRRRGEAYANLAAAGPATERRADRRDAELANEMANRRAARQGQVTTRSRNLQ